MKTLGDRVKDIRERKGLTQKGLADLIGVSQQAIQQIEKSPSGHTKYLAELANALNVSQSYLLGETVHSSPSLTKQNDIGYRQFLPVLEENDILPWVEHGVLPKRFRRANMSEFPRDASINETTYLKDITHDSFADEYFRVRLPNRELFAIVDHKASPVPYDIVIVQLPDKKIKFRQYIKDGSEYFLKPVSSLTEKTPLEGVKILGVVTGYHNKNIEAIENKE